MPYIEEGRRPRMDGIVDLMIKEDVKADGDLNYILFSFFCKHMLKIGPSYGRMKNFRGELTEIRDHIHERFLRQYEQRKCFENSDVPGAEELSRKIRDY